MVDSLSDQHIASKIQVQIGAMDTVPKHLTLKAFHKAQTDYKCVVSILEGHGDELLRELRAHRLDLVISNYSPSAGESAGFYAKNIARMPVVICGSSKFSGLKRGFPASLNGQPFIMPSMQSKLRHDIEHYLKLSDIFVDTIAEVQDTSLQKLMGTHGDGLIPVALPRSKNYLPTKNS